MLKSARLNLETAGHRGERTWFCTLTFAQAPSDEAAGYAEVQKWIKRVRVVLARAGILEKGLRYYCVAEHGRLHQRLHYHLLLWSPVQLKQRDIAPWHKGHYQYRVAVGGMWRYMMKYLQKQGGKARGSAKLGEEFVNTAATSAVCAAVLDNFPGARIVRVGGRFVPRALGDKFVHKRDERSELTDDEREIMESSTDDLIRSTERISLSGHDYWAEPCPIKSKRKTRRYQLFAEEADDYQTTGQLFGDLPKGAGGIGNRGETSQDDEGGPDGSN